MKRVGYLLFDQVQGLDVVGSMDAFDSANQWLRMQGQPPAFELVTVALCNKNLQTETGMRWIADETLSTAEPLDWLVIPGGAGARKPEHQRRLSEWLEEHEQRLSRIISICTGAYLLAASGLMTDKRCCSHWRFIEDLQHCFPKVTFDADALFIRDGKFFTSGGLTAGIDLSLWLIELELGTQVAQHVARDLVVYLRRSGDQSQFATPLPVQSMDSRLTRLQDWLLENIRQPVTVAQMAERMAMSERHFRRVFQKQMRMSPKSYLEQLKLERARDLLVSSAMQVEQIAGQVGYTQSDIFRRVFKKRYGVTPQEYRCRFQ